MKRIPVPIIVESGIPVWGTTRGHPPMGGKGGLWKYPFLRMAVGDSFAIPVTPATLRKTMNTLCSAAARVFGPGCYTTRVTPDKDAIRLWRTA